jgi:Ca2+-binding EF-hand superfamily protein
MKLHSFRWLMLTGLLTGSLAHANHHEKSEGKHEDMHGEAMHGDRMPPMFSQFDKNKDGRVSREEAREGMDRLFAEADTNKDGFISTEEMQAHHHSMREQFRQSMRDSWKKADTDGDGALSKAEAEAAKMLRLVRDFDKLDKNKDGKLTPDEVAASPHHKHAPQP